MKVLQIFAHFTDEQWKLLVSKYPSEVLLKIMLSEKLTAAIYSETEQIKTDNALNVLSAERKL